ncbi:MAG: hypothetical protein FWE94_05555 [Coriobacteriia bacterium]|nr:hypothetical protein [Coriobacteriia bacterium]
MKSVLCIDDTDSLTKKISTGKIADYIKGALVERGIGICSAITRHQLLLHEDIPYTSHNSSMCMELETEGDKSAEIISLGTNVLEEHMDESSSPGFCYCISNALSETSRGELIGFGKRAKREVLKKEDAYHLAERLGLHLSEHGGTGQGVIGAVAGIGLRLSGDDGTYRGKMKITPTRSDGLISVDDICAQSGASEVRDMEGAVLGRGQLLHIGEHAKAIRVDHKKVIMVSRQEDGSYRACTKEELRGLRD